MSSVPFAIPLVWSKQRPQQQMASSFCVSSCSDCLAHQEILR
jgi:hypothetical protein